MLHKEGTWQSLQSRNNWSMHRFCFEYASDPPILSLPDAKGNWQRCRLFSLSAGEALQQDRHAQRLSRWMPLVPSWVPLTSMPACATIPASGCSTSTMATGWGNRSCPMTGWSTPPRRPTAPMELRCILLVEQNRQGVSRCATRHVCCRGDGQFIYIIPSKELVIVRTGFSKEGSSIRTDSSPGSWMLSGRK